MKLPVVEAPRTLDVTIEPEDGQDGIRCSNNRCVFYTALRKS